MNCLVYYNHKQHMFLFMTSSDSIDCLYGCYRTTNEILDEEAPLIITQAFRANTDHFNDDLDFMFLGDYFIQDNYYHNLKETLLSEYPELFI